MAKKYFSFAIQLNLPAALSSNVNLNGVQLNYGGNLFHLGKLFGHFLPIHQEVCDNIYKRLKISTNNLILVLGANETSKNRILFKLIDFAKNVVRGLFRLFGGRSSRTFQAKVLS